MNVQVAFDEQDVKWLEKMSRKFGGIITVEFAGVVRRLANRMKKSVEQGGGLYGIPAFAPRATLTERLHGPSWGGLYPLKQMIGYWRSKKSGEQFIGFKSKNKLAMVFGQTLQTAADREFSKDERRAIYRLGMNRRTHSVDVFTYHRPARPVVRAFIDDQRGFLYSETRRRVERILKSEAKVQAANAKIRSKTLKQLRKK